MYMRMHMHMTHRYIQYIQYTHVCEYDHDVYLHAMWKHLVCMHIYIYISHCTYTHICICIYIYTYRLYICVIYICIHMLVIRGLAGHRPGLCDLVQATAGVALLRVGSVSTISILLLILAIAIFSITIVTTIIVLVLSMIRLTTIIAIMLV